MRSGGCGAVEKENDLPLTAGFLYDLHATPYDRYEDAMSNDEKKK